MNNIVNAVVSELIDKNATWDMIKMCVRVAITASGMEFTQEEKIEIISECGRLLPFNPSAGL